MATDTLQAKSACENSTTSKDSDDAFLEAHAAWRRAKAAWEAALYAPGMAGRDLPEEEDMRLCTAHCEALDAFFRTPSKSLGSFIWKLRAFRDEEIFNNDNASEISDALINDAARLWSETRHGK